MKTKWLHIVGAVIAFSSIFIGVQMQELFITFSIAIPIMIRWSAKSSFDEEVLRKMSTIEMNALQRGIEKGLRKEETIILALLIPSLVLAIRGHLMGGLFLGLITVGMMLSTIAGELELEKMERIERETLGISSKQEYPLRELAKGFSSMLKREFSALWCRERGVIPFFVRTVGVIGTFIDIVIFRKSRSALLDYIGL